MPRNFFNVNGLSSGSNDLMAFKVSFYGRWAETIHIINKLSPIIRETSLEAQLSVGGKIVKIVKGHIRNQDLHWKPLEGKYAQRKEKDLGSSDKILISYKTYYNNIQVWKVGNRHLVNIGVKKGIYTKELNGRRSKIDVATIAAIHEFSSGKRLARRPLWNPTIREIGGVKGIKTMYVNSLVNRMRRRHIPVKVLKGSRIGIIYEGTKIHF